MSGAERWEKSKHDSSEVLHGGKGSATLQQIDDERRDELVDTLRSLYAMALLYPIRISSFQATGPSLAYTR